MPLEAFITSGPTLLTAETRPAATPKHRSRTGHQTERLSAASIHRVSRASGELLPIRRTADPKALASQASLAQLRPVGNAFQQEVPARLRNEFVGLDGVR